MSSAELVNSVLIAIKTTLSSLPNSEPEYILLLDKKFSYSVSQDSASIRRDSINSQLNSSGYDSLVAGDRLARLQNSILLAVNTLVKRNSIPTITYKGQRAISVANRAIIDSLISKALDAGNIEEESTYIAKAILNTPSPIMEQYPDSAKAALEKLSAEFENSTQKRIIKNAIAIAERNSNKTNIEFETRVNLIKKLSSKGGTDIFNMEITTIAPEEMGDISLSIYQAIDSLADLKGSKSISEMVDEMLDAAIDGKSYQEKTSTSVKKTTKTTISKPVTIIKPKFNITTSTIKGKQIQKLRLNGKFSSLASLLAIINNQLHDRIRANMGKGNARAILNYRTGRFANSVKILKLDTTKNAGIAAMYTYMKYPYQTFEPGFKQGSKTRDPRVLIQKSIRQIVNDKFSKELNYRFTRL